MRPMWTNDKDYTLLLYIEGSLEVKIGGLTFSFKRLSRKTSLISIFTITTPKRGQLPRVHYRSESGRQ